ARAHVDADVWLGAERTTVLDEIVGSEAIGFLSSPRELDAARTCIARTDAVDPVIAADEIAARPAQHRHVESARGIQHVGTKAALVRKRRTFVEDAAVNAPPEVLDELAEDASVEATYLAIDV